MRVFRLSCGRCRIPTCEEAEFLIKTFNCDFSNILGYDAKSHIILLVNYDISKPCVRVQVLRYLSIFGADIVKGCKYVDGKWQPVDFSNLYSQQFLGMFVRGCTMLVSFLLTYLTNRVFPLKVWIIDFISMSSQQIQPVMNANAMTIQSRRNRRNNALCILLGCIFDVLLDRISHARTSTMHTSSNLNTKGTMSIVSWP